MGKYTQGPWKILPPEKDKTYLRIRGTHLGGAYKIANVIVESYEGCNENEAMETVANACLIAAAPELLAALNLYELSFVNEKEARAEFGNAAVERELTRRSVVTKATGETE